MKERRQIIDGEGQLVTVRTRLPPSDVNAGDIQHRFQRTLARVDALGELAYLAYGRQIGYEHVDRTRRARRPQSVTNVVSAGSISGNDP